MQSFKTFLIITLFQLPLSASYQLYQDPHQPAPTIQNEVYEITLQTPLSNTGTTLGNLLMSGHLTPFFTIPKVTDGTNIGYLYNTTLDPQNPFLIGTYALRLVTHNLRVCPMVTGYLPQTIPPLNPYAPEFRPYSHDTQNCFQPLPFALPQFSYPEIPSLPPIHPVILGALEGRKLALIDLIQKTNISSKPYLETSSTNRQWDKIIKVACQDFNYPFTALDLSFPSQNDVESTPKQVPYTHEDEIKKMEAELSLESTPKERKIFLRSEIEFLSEFLKDMQKDHLPHYGSNYHSKQFSIQDKEATPPAIVAQENKTSSTPSPSSSPETVSLPISKKQKPIDPIPTLDRTVVKQSNKSVTIVPASLPTQKKSAAVTLPPSTPSQPHAKRKEPTQSTAVPQSTPSQAHAKRKAPTQSAAVPQSIPSKVEKKSNQKNKSTFLDECLAAATTNAALPAQKDSPLSTKQAQENTGSPVASAIKKDEPPKLSDFEKKVAAAEQYRLKKLEQEQEKAAARAEKIVLEEQRYTTIEKACEEKDYESAIKALQDCDQTTERFGAILVALTNHLTSAKARDTFPQLNGFILNFLKQKKCTLSDDQKSHLLLHLGLQENNEMRLVHLQQAAALKNIAAEVELFTLQAKQLLTDPASIKCIAGERCLHKKIAQFFKLHSENQSLKYFPSIYKLSLLSLQSGCQNIELSMPREQLYVTAQLYLSPDDYDDLLTEASITKEPTASTAPQEDLSSPNLTASFEKSFEKFYTEIKTTYRKPHSKAATQTLINFFFNQTSTNEQILFIFNRLSEEPELAIFFETFHELMKSKKPLPFMSRKIFEALSISVAQNIAANITKISSNPSDQTQKAILYLKKIQVLASAPNSLFPQGITFSDNRFTPLMHEIFIAYRAFTSFKASKERSASEKPKLKSTFIKIVAQEQKKVEDLVITILKTVKTETDVRELILSVNRFSNHECYNNVRDILDAYLSTAHSEEEKRHWRLYKILPNPSKFYSLSPYAAAGSFLVRCEILKKELGAYLASVPAEPEVFKATEEIIVKFLSTSKNPHEMQQFVASFNLNPISYFCVGGLLTHVARSTAEEAHLIIPLFKQLKEQLDEQISKAEKKPIQKALQDYLKETYSKVEAFLHNYTPQATEPYDHIVIEFSSLKMGAATPFETVFDEFKKNLDAFSQVTQTQDLIDFKKTFIMQLFEKAHTLTDLQMVIQGTMNDTMNGPLYFDVFLDFLKMKTVDIPEAAITELVEAFKLLLDKQVLSVFMTTRQNASRIAQPAYLAHYLQYLRELQIKVNHLCIRNLT